MGSYQVKGGGKLEEKEEKAHQLTSPKSRQKKNTSHLSLRQGGGFSLHKLSVDNPSKTDYARL